ncbi:SLAM family member 5-like [Nelusetta ayraudi]|uniref:SLAM family member 5-like n=1 Tax=Nelusetta ayraudi TaxID=303726 RepID=UPI003F70EE51
MRERLCFHEMAPRYLLPSFLIFFCLGTVQSVIYKLKGQQIQWVPVATEPPNEILWNHNGNKVVEFDGNVEKVYGSYEGRVTLNRQTAQLQINDLRLEDSGKYDSEIYLQGKWLETSFELKVIENVGKPTITCQMSPDCSSKMSAVLLCIEDLSQAPSPLKFEWISGGKVQPGKQLTISLGGELNTQQYICQVSNPLSQENATFTAKDCYTDAGLSGGLIAAIILIIILVISACVVILLLALKHKGFKKKELQQVELESQPSPAAAPSRAEVLLNTPYYSAYQRSQLESSSQTGVDEEKKPFLEDQHTAASPQPQNQLDSDNSKKKKPKKTRG